MSYIKKSARLQASSASSGHPYTAWERGTNENIHGLIRWYLPKGTDFSMISEEQIIWIESRLNNRPRKCLGFKTPLEAATTYVALQG